MIEVTWFMLYYSMFQIVPTRLCTIFFTIDYLTSDNMPVPVPVPLPTVNDKVMSLAGALCHVER